MKYVTSRIADLKVHEEFVQEILNSIKRQEKVIYFLTHPRNWNASLGNIGVDIRRITDGAAVYKIKKIGTSVNKAEKTKRKECLLYILKIRRRVLVNAKQQSKNSEVFIGRIIAFRDEIR